MKKKNAEHSNQDVPYQVAKSKHQTNGNNWHIPYLAFPYVDSGGRLNLVDN